MKIQVVTDVLAANDRIADENRALFAAKKIYVINLMSSPGAGKTSLVEKTILALRDRFRIGVIEGDIQSTYDAERVAALDTPVVQINTGGGCHLDANMIREALPSLDLDAIDLLIVENVGNLVCPAEFQIGEDAKVMILSTPEGADKPLKYPLIFRESQVMILNKIDLLPHVDFDREKARRAALALNPDLEIFEVSCRTGEGLPAWFDWLAAAGGRCSGISGKVREEAGRHARSGRGSFLRGWSRGSDSGRSCGGRRTPAALPGLSGTAPTGSIAEVEGEAAAVEAFLAGVREQLPPLAAITRITRTEIPPTGEEGFSIAASDAAGPGEVQISPDIATCDACLAELFDPADRRFRYPFINCTDCGPRLTIINAIPYDRANTSMACFPLCPECRKEYENPADRRFHAEPNACPVCGPRLELLDADGRPLSRRRSR